MPHAVLRTRSMKAYFDCAGDLHPRQLGYTQERAETMADLAYLDGMFTAVRRARHKADELAKAGCHQEAQALEDFVQSLFALIDGCSASLLAPTDARIQEWVDTEGVEAASRRVRKALPGCGVKEAHDMVCQAMAMLKKD